jgi:hypothetical protein
LQGDEARLLAGQAWNFRHTAFAINAMAGGAAFRRNLRTTRGITRYRRQGKGGGHKDRRQGYAQPHWR